MITKSMQGLPTSSEAGQLEADHYCTWSRAMILRDSELPVAISEDRLAASPMQSTAVAALVAAPSDR